MAQSTRSTTHSVAPSATNTLVPLLRRGLLGLAGIMTLGIGVELAVERHWTQPIQLVAWGSVGGLAVALTLVAWAPSRNRVRAARVLAVLVVLSAILGVGAHVYANYDAGVLDQQYSSTWDRLPEVTRWLLAMSKTVGPSPPFAPGALAEAGLGVLLATLRHPALGAATVSRGRDYGRLGDPEGE